MIKTIKLVCVLFLFGCVAPKKSLPPPTERDSYKVVGIEIYTCLAGSTPKMNRLLNKKGVKRSILINGSNFTDSTFLLKKKKLKLYIEKHIPNKESTALVVLDFEGKKMQRLEKTKNLVERKKLIHFFIDVYQFVKELRPKATIGYYGIPWRDYWNRNENWRASNDLLLPLIRKVDALFPSVYDFYPGTQEKQLKRDFDYVFDNVHESLRLAKVYQKKVYPFVWHRYHNSSEKKLEFINSKEFQNHISAIGSVDYNGRSVNGIVWWSSEQYFYNVSKRGKKIGSTEDFSDFFNHSTLDYLELIEKGLLQSKK